jgi:hypothetical protein
MYLYMKKGKMEENKKKYLFRKDFLRHLAVVGIGIASGSMFYKAYQSGESCISDGKCKTCVSNTKCNLELAKEYREKLRRHRNG